MNQALINLIQQNWTKKVRGKRGRGNTVRLSKENLQAGAAEAMQQFDQIIRLSGQQWWRSYYQQNVQDPLDRTDREMWRVQCNICDEYINLKCYDKKNISAADYFFCNLHRIMNINISCSWHDKLIVLWILNRQAKISLCTWILRSDFISNIQALNYAMK